MRCRARPPPPSNYDFILDLRRRQIDAEEYSAFSAFSAAIDGIVKDDEDGFTRRPEKAGSRSQSAHRTRAGRGGAGGGARALSRPQGRGGHVADEADGDVVP